MRSMARQTLKGALLQRTLEERLLRLPVVGTCGRYGEEQQC
jgi:hypothetical protein